MRWALAIVGCAVLVAAAIYLGAWASPPQNDQQAVARLLYLHVPVAVNTLLAFTVAAVASLLVLWRKSDGADRLARAAAGVGLLMGTLMLASGALWARLAWGHWWDFKSPRLMLSLVLWILFVAYFVLRASLSAGQRQKRVAAAYCLVAYLDVPLVYLSTRLLTSDIHSPSVAALDARPPGLWAALPVALAATTAVAAALLAAGLRGTRRNDAQAART